MEVASSDTIPDVYSLSHMVGSPSPVPSAGKHVRD